MATPRPVRHVLTLVKLVCVVVVAGLLCAGFVVPYVVGIGAVSNAATSRFLDTKCTLRAASLQQTTSVYARDGVTLIAKFFENNRKSVPLATVPTAVRYALIDTEDRRFFQHHGVDPRGLARAALNNSGGATQGASTLTQQLVKQIRLYTATTRAQQQAATAQTVNRKIFEAKCALDLEHRYTKNQILEQYFNIAYFGEQSYGIWVAARTYFDKTPAQLSVPEAAVLTGLVKDPTLYDPFQNPKAARERRDEVIQNMADAGHLTAKAAVAYKKTPIQLTSKPANLGAQGCSFANDKAIANVGFFCDYAMNWLETAGGMTDRELKTGGLRITTSIDPAMQDSAEKKLFKKFPATSASTVIQPAVNPQTGEILAMIASKHYNYAEAHTGDAGYTSANLFKGAFAGSGSTYKYFSLITALEAGFRADNKLTTSSSYIPKNCPQKQKKPTHNAGTYPATMTLRNATVKSSNTFFVGLEDQLFGCDLSTIVNTATALGMDTLKAKAGDGTDRTLAQTIIDQSQYNFTLGQNSTSTLELAEAFGVSANGGVECGARPILSISDVHGRAVPFKQSSCQRVLDPWVARTAIDITKGDTVTGTARKYFTSRYYPKLSRKDHWVAGKTGTNNASKCSQKVAGRCVTYTDNGHNSSLWFVGMTPKLVATSAIVNIDNTTSDVKLPGVKQTYSATEAFGSYASQYWIDSFQPTLAKTSWQWQSPSQVPDAQDTPSVRGLLPDVAEVQIRSAGFIPVRYPIDCGSRSRTGVVAYVSPAYAAPGSKVTYCVSNGKSPKAQPAPRVIVKKPTNTTGGTGTGTNPTRTTSPRPHPHTTPTHAPRSTSAPTTHSTPTTQPKPTTTPTPKPTPTTKPKPTPAPTTKPTTTPKPTPKPTKPKPTKPAKSTAPHKPAAAVKATTKKGKPRP